MREHFDVLRQADRDRRRRNLDRAGSSTLPWRKHSEHHWSLVLCGDRLDYWPSTTKFRWRGRTYQGGVEGFIRNHQRKDSQA